METTLSHTQSGALKKRGGPGRPSELERRPNLVAAIVNGLDDGKSMREVAEENEIGVRTLHDWARSGERLQSGPMHEIALAVERSKRRRGFGKKLEPGASSAATGTQSDSRAVQVVGSSKEWTDIGFVAGNGTALQLKDLLNDCMRWALEASRCMEPMSPPVNPAGPPREANARGYCLPSSGHYLLLKAGTPGNNDRWDGFPFGVEEFESLYNKCQSNGRRYLGHLNPIERRWPRDFNALTPEQRTIITKNVRVLVCDADGQFFEVDFKVGEC